MPFCKVNGANLYYEDQGSGKETIIFTHNLMFSCRMFDDQVNALKDQYRCVTFDFRGQGRSEVTQSGYDMDTLTQDCACIIEHLGCAPSHFVGFSMGGFVGLRLAMRRPELLRSLVLASTVADAQPRQIFPAYKLLNFVARWIGTWAVADQVMPTMFSQSFLDDPTRSDSRKMWKQRLLNNDRVGITRAVTGVMSRASVDDQLDQISVPTLIMYSEWDLQGLAEKSKNMHAMIPNSELVIIPRAGHMAPVEEPEAVNAALKEFLSS